ncbi:MAG: bifunctional (p)ppGpp synthetase/guanosine-3',5'-bis(diphosphate) 3'-pyrophosphohydrolase [Lachnospiraceae bacterium]|nr:bifunctional (p)ppGpp synthetase/guanosine-3',5'-bis(diphosphate) 3'-pyrophosphohydrolase [Lachnospiraceae bacterium]
MGDYRGRVHWLRTEPLQNIVMNIETAEKIARQLHEGQFRADGVTPYIEHPKVVAELVKEYGGSEKSVCVAWLHDIMEENAEGTRKLLRLDRIDSKARFIMDMKSREDWAGIVFDLAKISDHWDLDQKEIKERGKVVYLAKLLLTASSDLLLVKLCDMLANIRESKGTRKSQEKRYRRAVRCFSELGDKSLTESHKKLIAAILDRTPL